MLKKSTIVFTSCSNFPSGHATSSKTSSCRIQHSSRPVTPPGRQLASRGYAMVADGHSRHKHEYIPWPEVTKAQRIPTPYQIFAIKKGAPYSKRRFYELVKLYHPDKHTANSDDTIPYDTKLERYRLVVAANDLLSDPTKRSAYDMYGAGWNGQPGVITPRDGGEDQNWGPHSGRAWGSGPNGPFHNATWEDWERWYQRDQGKGKQAPLYFSNGAFFSLIVMFAALGGVGQATRVGNYSSTFLEQRDELHKDMSHDLMRRRKESAMMGNRDVRIQEFLRQRDYGVMDTPEEAYRKLLPAPEICSSSDIEARPMDIYERKRP